jgi:hypothetical protein
METGHKFEKELKMGRNVISAKLYTVLKTSLRGSQAVVAYAAGWRYS